MVLPYYLRHHLKPDIYGKGWAGMIKQGFYEAPYLTVSLLLFPGTFVLIPYVVWRNKQLGNDKRRFMSSYTVYRPGDRRLNFFYKVIDRTKPSTETGN